MKSFSFVTIRSCAVIAIVLLAAHQAESQTSQGLPNPPIQLVQPQGQAGPPIVITLQDALDRAKQLDGQYLGSLSDAAVAAEDRRQAKAGLFPMVIENTQYLNTQGNGELPSGRFVTNDGIHVYRQWGVFRQDLSPNTFLQTGYKRAQVAEAVARARVDIARLGLAVTVSRNYYALATAQRKYATAQLGVQQAQRFLELTQQQERLGQVAHADTVKAELQYQLQKQGYDDATLAMEIARLNLAVMLFPTLNENFTIVDDLDSAQALPPFTEVQELAQAQNPDLRAASELLKLATLEVRGARNALLPSLFIDTDYGIEANAFALRSSVAADPEHRIVPNLGYFLTANLTIPIWDWGALRSRVRQTQIRERQVQVLLTQTQRQLVGNLYAAYNEALAARSAVASMRHAADLATESLRLINLRYSAGESTALEVVDALNALVQARNAYDDAQSRFRLAISALQALTGGF